MDHNAIANDAYFGIAVHFSIEHETSCDGSHFSDVEHFTDLDVAGNLLFELRCKHTFHRRFDLFDGFVDDGVHADVDLLCFRQLAGTYGRTYLEPDNDRIGSGS